MVKINTDKYGMRSYSLNKEESKRFKELISQPPKHVEFNECEPTKYLSGEELVRLLGSNRNDAENSDILE